MSLLINVLGIDKNTFAVYLIDVTRALDVLGYYFYKVSY